MRGCHFIAAALGSLYLSIFGIRSNRTSPHQRQLGRWRDVANGPGSARGSPDTSEAAPCERWASGCWLEAGSLPSLVEQLGSDAAADLGGGEEGGQGGEAGAEELAAAQGVPAGQGGGVGAGGEGEVEVAGDVGGGGAAAVVGAAGLAEGFAGELGAGGAVQGGGAGQVLAGAGEEVVEDVL